LVAATTVETLAVYEAADQSKLLAFCGASVFDVSAGVPGVPVAGTAVAAGRVSAYASTAMFSNAADNSQHLIIVTGSDTPAEYNGGAAFTNLVMTGITTPADLNFTFAFKGRLYFGAKNKLGFYYLGVGLIQGALTYFDLAQVSRNGGYLLAIASFSDGGETPNDYIVFITSTGECIVYEGYDPSAVANWTLVGRYFSPTPISQRCAIPFSGDLLLLTVDGLLPFSVIRKSGLSTSGGVTDSRTSALTSKLGHYLSDLNAYKAQLAWCGTVYSKNGWLMLNAPGDGGNTISRQFVMNTTTGAWGAFTNWKAMCFSVFKDQLYFGNKDGYVVLADYGSDDPLQGSEAFGTYVISVRQAYNYFETPVPKHFQWATLIMIGTGNIQASITASISFGVDFTDGALVASDFRWTSVLTTQKCFVALNAEGAAGSLGFSMNSGHPFEWIGTQFVIEPTQGLTI
jgi:hypothetical protein